jgi:acyl transferase domain-containing protein
MDIAIIGLACRFPGADNPGEFWHFLRDGHENTRFADTAAEFDADFFNLSPREACAMDPRQRLALELAWELFEEACIVPRTISGQSVSVYIGAMTDDYTMLTLRDLAHDPDHYSYAGLSRGMIANRISYALGLQGPSMTVDSGQSSSLVSVHLACKSLRSGESPLAIAGGIQLNLAPETALLEAEFGALSASGHTYAFDWRADGYVRGEGGGLVLLKPLPAALKDGDRIHAVVRGSAVGNAGHSAAGQSAPSAAGQTEVIRRALCAAGLNTLDIDYVEAHGTGTRAGDAAEVSALGEVFAGRPVRPVIVGSVKTNIGHTGAAAGIAGLLKAVLALEHSMVPPHLHHSGANPGLDSDQLQITTRMTPWPDGGGLRRAGVSSFGMGGTNAHVIVEQAPVGSGGVAESVAGEGVVVPWVLSARSLEALAGQAGRLAAWVGADPGLGVVDVGWSLVTTRSVFEHRAVLVGGDREALLAQLAGVVSAPVVGRARSVGKTVWVFPGQGSQLLGMGRQLCERFAVFAAAFDEVAAAVDGQLRVPLREVMWGADAQLLQDTEFAQPALFAVEVALAALWGSWGVSPDVVMGHSVGEIAAACVAGVLSLSDAARLVVVRGRLMARLAAGGVMVAVAAGEAEVAPLLGAGVAIAAVNGPEAVVISGARAGVDAVVDRLVRAGRRVQRLAVSHAFHSPLMEPMLAEFARAVADVSVGAARVEVVSNLTGQRAGAGYGSGPYWVRHVREPVRFCQGVRAAQALGGGVFLELGPGAALSAAVQASVIGEQVSSVVTMPQGRPEVDAVLEAAGQLFTAGVDLDWAQTFTGLHPQRVALPTYAFTRQHYWLYPRPDPMHPRSSQHTDLDYRLLDLPPDEQRRRLFGLVCRHAAEVLGHPDGHVIDPDRAFHDLGFESLTGVQLRNRLTADTGLVLPRTLIFDHPSAAALADHLCHQIRHPGDDESEEEKIWSSLRNVPISELRRTGLLETLLLLADGSEKSSAAPAVSADAIDALSTEALIAMALNADDDENTRPP